MISPLGFPVNESTKYAGIEQLVWNFASELVKTHKVTVLCHSQSKFPLNVACLPIEPIKEDIYFNAEVRQYQTYQGILRNFDVIHDFSHQHFASRCNVNLPSLNIFWHAPNEIQYPKAPYNIVGLSKWACRSFAVYYHQNAKFQQTIALDTQKYADAGRARTDRFLTLGVMSPQKGNLEAAKLCKEAGVPLDICGQPFDGGYVKRVEEYCDGNNIIYHGEISEEKKILLYQSCKALIYHLPVPEVTSHKVQEAMLCGAPVITQYIGALPEIITDGIDGILCDNDEDYRKALGNVSSLNPSSTHDKLVETYSIENVVKNYIPLYEKVAGGLRW